MSVVGYDGIFAVIFRVISFTTAPLFYPLLACSAGLLRKPSILNRGMWGRRRERDVEKWGKEREREWKIWKKEEKRREKLFWDSLFQPWIRVRSLSALTTTTTRFSTSRPHKSLSQFSNLPTIGLGNELALTYATTHSRDEPSLGQIALPNWSYITKKDSLSNRCSVSVSLSL